MTAVGFIGLGQIGAPMARRLLGYPGGLVVYDVRPDASAPFAEGGAHVADGIADVSRDAGIISIMVRTDQQVRDVVTELLPAANAGTILAIHSTIGSGTAEELAQEAAERDVAIVDAPVVGGFMGAMNGTLAVLAGGPDDAVERCRAPFSHWAELIVHFGPVGSGTRAKLARNLLQFVAYSAAAEAQALAEAAGVDLLQLGVVVRHSDKVTGGPGAIMIRPTTARLEAADPLYEILTHTRELGEKDLALALELGRELGVELPFAELARQRFAGGLGLEPGGAS